MRRVAVALLAGLVVWALLLPWGGCIDTDPPVCTALLGWFMVSEPWVAWVAGAATAAVVFLILSLRARRPDSHG